MAAHGVLNERLDGDTRGNAHRGGLHEAAGDERVGEFVDGHGGEKVEGSGDSRPAARR
jgi:hypothetical protein